ncbi:MAG: carbohydrate porin [Nitrospirota bacterium]
MIIKDRGGRNNEGLLSAAIFVIMFLFGMSLGSQALAQEGDKTYSGDFWSRSTLTGDWGGTRNEWAAKGVTFDINLTQTGMSNISGGKNQGWEYSGRGSLTLNIDTQKLGLWPGGFFTVEVEGNYNKSINFDTGAVMPVNTNQLFPMPGDQELNIPEVAFTQFLSHYFGVILGKLDTTSGDPNEFAHGKGDKQFSNLAFNFNPAALLTVPNSALGAGVIILPTKDPNEAIISMMVIDSNGKANRSGFDTAFEGNNTYGIEGRVRTDFFGMTGHQLFGVSYSGKDFASLDQGLRFIIENGAIEKEDNSWAFHYNFDQYIYEPKKGRGIGIFGRFGISDGDANPIHHFYSIGLGGKGVIPSRELDELGIGYYYVDVSNPKFTGPLADRSFLRDEYGVEAYYNIAITPWMKLTPDIQVIRPAQKQVLQIDEDTLLLSKKKDVDTATVIGLRLQVVF